ncbi:3-dehydroquinate synthase [Desulfosarcina sp. OttesenSCG-928-A07]|nr:3-dehydroquinate synthase [Desulfosarcina sp. OttesenSCG-928-G17]MDL2328587.1 3-dehydroquinate synthase [Desulfosarcina sp. OttesenSCG-928-A07]
MKTFQISGTFGNSSIFVGESITRIGNYVPVENTVILADTRVSHYYRELFPACPVISIGLGEKIKTLETVSDIYRQLVDLGADRATFLLGIGGGIVCDITGFVASTYMRGIRFGFVSTTLLSQVDASVGGKNGVNLGGYKNMVGTFNQPEIVICDMALLKTLPRREVLCGMAEIIKHGAISSAAMVAELESSQKAAMALDPEVISSLVYQSVAIKAGVVSRDEREHGERRKLNFGHTFGHAIEKCTGLAHGEAVAIGMAMAARLSVTRKMLSQADAHRLIRLIQSYDLPVHPPVETDILLAAMEKDKKREGRNIHFVFLDTIGNAQVERITLDALRERVRITDFSGNF